MVATLGFNELTVMQVLVQLDLAWLANGFQRRKRCWDASCSLRAKNVDDILQAVTILGKQVAQLVLKLNFFLQLIAAFQCFQFRKLRGKFLFELAKFSQTGHRVFLYAR